MRGFKQWVDGRNAWDQHCPWGDIQAGQPALATFPQGPPGVCPELGSRTALPAGVPLRKHGRRQEAAVQESAMSSSGNFQN